MAAKKTYKQGFSYGRKKYDSFLDADIVKPKRVSPIAKAASKALAELPEELTESIPELILRLHPNWLDPYHLKPLYDEFDKIQRGEKVRLCLSVPPRHGKTEGILTGLVRYLMTHEEKEIMYLSYAMDFAEEKSKWAKGYAQMLGAKVRRDSQALARWTIEGMNSTFRASGIVGGQTTGLGADILVIDDPHKGRTEAEQVILRDKIYEEFLTTGLSRLSPNASVIVVHTRFHPDDLIGKILKNKDLEFKYINLPAIKDNGEALWPERWPLAELELKRKPSEYNWASLYMGQPRPRGSSLFKELPSSNYYEKLPDARLSYSVGYDLAYTAKTYADWSVAVVTATDGNNIYVLNVIRRQCEASKFAGILESLRATYPNACFLSYIAGPEKGSVNLLNTRGLKLSFLQANTDKFSRAQGVSSAWNLGKIFLPKEADWLDDFLTEVTHFTGVSDPNDDQVDALAGAYAALSSRPVRRDLTNIRPFI